MTDKPMLSVELLPCPYCGSSANLEDLRLVWCVRCTKCSACVLGDRAPEPHGDGISSNEIQDAQAGKMAENTDWASYEKSAVDAWNSRSTPATQHQGEPVAWAHEDGLAGLSVAAKTTWPSYAPMSSHRSDYDGITVPLFRGRPEPVAAVERPEHQDDPEAGDSKGWVCEAPGTPGTWER